MTALKENWDFYQCHVNDKAASIYVNLGLKEIAPDAERPDLLIVWLHLLHPNSENGLSTQDEFEALVEIEDVLVPNVEREYLAIYAGRITNDGRREFYFYSAKAEDFEVKVVQILSKFSEYKFEAWTDLNADWEHYLNLLFPSANALRWIGDRKVVEQLESHGDQPAIERPIEHWAYFPSTDTRQHFEESLHRLGFSSVNKYLSDGVDMAHCIVFSKIQTIKSLNCCKLSG
jgi:Family of unknown function (DUF695)/Regulator of ribonuclease activity B